MKAEDQLNDRIIEIFSGTIWEAEMVKSLLENASIPCFTKNDVLHTFAYEPITSEGVKVMISNRDLEEARPIVQTYYDNLKAP